MLDVFTFNFWSLYQWLLRSAPVLHGTKVVADISSGSFKGIYNANFKACKKYMLFRTYLNIDFRHNPSFRTYVRNLECHGISRFLSHDVASK